MTVKAVEMVRKIRDNHFQETKNLTFEEQIKYFKEKSEKLRKQCEKLAKSSSQR